MFSVLFLKILEYVWKISLFLWFIFLDLLGSIHVLVFSRYILTESQVILLLLFLLSFIFLSVLLLLMSLTLIRRQIVYIFYIIESMLYRIFYLNDSKEIAKVDTVYSALDICTFIKVVLLNIRSNCLSLPGYPHVQNVLIYQDDYCCFDSRLRFFPGRNVLSTRPHTVQTFKKICASHLSRFQPSVQATDK